jgi:Icc-related predicted phosphoesterase
MLVLGDAHADNDSNRQFLHRAYSDTTDEYAVQVGDLLYYTLPKPTWFIAGNNEDHDRTEPAKTNDTPTDIGTNAYLLNGTSTEINGLTVTGLSGNFAPTQFDKSRSALINDRRRHFTHEDIDRILELTPTAIDILLTHEAPYNLITSENYTVGCPHIDTIIDEIQPRLCLVGHHHEHAETHRNQTRVISLAPIWDGYYTLSPDTLTLEFEPWNQTSLADY